MSRDSAIPITIALTSGMAFVIVAIIAVGDTSERLLTPTSLPPTPIQSDRPSALVEAGGSKPNETEIQNQSSNTPYESEAVGQENAVSLESLRSMPSQYLTDTERREVIAAAIDHDGVREWSDEWEFVNMGFGGTTEPIPRWTTAVVDLHLSPDAETAVACDTGWWARVEVDLLTKEVVSADYPTAEDKGCHGGLRMQGPVKGMNE